MLEFSHFQLSSKLARAAFQRPHYLFEPYTWTRRKIRRKKRSEIRWITLDVTIQKWWLWVAHYCLASLALLSSIQAHSSQNLVNTRFNNFAHVIIMVRNITRSLNRWPTVGDFFEVDWVKGRGGGNDPNLISLLTFGLVLTQILWGHCFFHKPASQKCCRVHFLCHPIRMIS